MMRHHKQKLRRGLHRVVSRQPDITFDRSLLQFEAGTRLNLSHDSLDRHWMNDVGFHFDPLECLLVDPEAALHAGEHLAISIGWLISVSACGVQDVYVVWAKLLLTVQVKIECLRQ